MGRSNICLENENLFTQSEDWWTDFTNKIENIRRQETSLKSV